MSGKRADSGGGIAGAGAIKQEKNQIVERDKDRRGLSTADLTGIFTERHIAPPVQNVLDLPMVADKLDDLM